MKALKSWLNLLKNTVSAFLADNGFRLSASLSYYTIFSLGPVMVIIISLSGIFFGHDAVRGKIYGEIQNLVGSDAALQLQEIIKNVEYSQYETKGLILGIAMLLIGASSVFTEIQDSINSIWTVKAKPRKGWWKFIRNRLLSFSLIISIGFISLVSLIVSAALDGFSERWLRLFPDSIIVLAYIANLLIVLFVVSSLFVVIFKVLPDAWINWKAVFRGALFTSILFMIGKFLISFYITQSKITSTYGTATSIIVILVWVYYSAVILFLGAEFTKACATAMGSPIRPKATAVFIIKKEEKEIPTSSLET